jgi:hypothetical protein
MRRYYLLGLIQPASGSSFVFDCANDRREYGAASTARDHLRDDAADA